MIKLISSAARPFTKAEAYWISPTGKILPVRDLHITEVLSNPEAFGFNRDELERAYKQHDELLGSEGKAREEIMTTLLKRGWIRIRYVPNHDLYSIQCFNFGKRQKDYLWQWAKDVTDNEFHKYADVRLDTGNKVEGSSVKGLMSTNILSSATSTNVCRKREKITYITDSYEFLEIPYE